MALFGLVPRMIYLVEYSRDPTFHLSILDTFYNEQMARQIADGKGAPPIPYFRAPGYPYFLAGIFSIVGYDYFRARLVQVLLSALTCGLTALLGARLFGAAAGVIAGAIIGLHGTLIVNAAEFLSPVQILLVNVPMLICLVEGARTGRTPWWIAAGIFAGQSVLVRADVVPFLAFVLAYAWWFFPQRRRWVPAALFCAMVALPVLATFARNAIHGGEAILLPTEGGVNWFMGNNPESDGVSVRLPGKLTWNIGWEDFKFVAEKETGRPMNYKEACSYFYGKGFACWRDNPAWMTKHLLRKLYLFWHGCELMNSRDDYASRIYSWVSRLTIQDRFIYLPFGLIGPLVIGAMFWLRRDRLAGILSLYMLCYWFFVSVFFVTMRFRLPTIPACAVLIGGFLVSVVPHVRRHWASGTLWGSRDFLVSCGLVAAALVAFNVEGIWRSNSPAMYHYMAGEASRQLKRPKDAVQHLEKALELKPDLEAAYSYLADAYRDMDDYANAERIYRRMLEKEPTNASIHSWLAEVLGMQERRKEACEAYETSIRYNPTILTAQIGYGMLLLDMGSTEPAKQRFLAAEAISPHAVSKAQLGSISAWEGRTTEALAYFEEALKLNPRIVDARMEMVRLLASQGRREEATRHLREALQAGAPRQQVEAVARQTGLALP